jgi:hypothetical protein
MAVSVARLVKDANWRKFQAALSSTNYEAKAKQIMRTATGQNALYIQGEARKRISPKRMYAANAALTLSIKGGKTAPLVDTARRIWQAIAIDVQAWNKAFVGVNFRNGAYNLAKMLHDGVDIKVTSRMRTMFFYLFLRGQGRPVTLTGRAAELWKRWPGEWRPLKDTTQVIHIPERRFMLDVIEDPVVLRNVRKVWRQAMEYVFKKLMAGGGT